MPSFISLLPGCQWRQLPHDFPCWSTVYSYFRIWCDDGTWRQINDHLRMQVRVSEDLHPSPSAAICDAQSVKVGNPRCHSIGFDGGKMVKGRKRHVLVDTLGLILMVIVTAANISDQRGTKILFWKRDAKVQVCPVWFGYGPMRAIKDKPL